MVYEDYDLPQALKTCDKLHGSYDQTSCYGGVYMENIVTGQGQGAIPGHETEWVSDDPHYPCNSVDKDFGLQFQCYQMQTSWMLTLSGYNFSYVAEECLNAPPNLIAVCFKSYGRDAAGNSLRKAEKMASLCSLVPEDYRYQCIIGAVNVVVDFWGEKLHGQASDFCKVLEEPDKKTCYQTLKGRLGGLFSNSKPIQDICRTMEIDYKEECMNSAT